MDSIKRAPGVRRAEIRRIVRATQAVTVDDLCKLLHASPATIRRDLAALEKQDALERSRGGAVAPVLRQSEQNFAQREVRDAAQKRAIAEAVVPLIQVGSTLFLNDGSTVMAIAKALVEKGAELFVATPGVNVALTLAENPAISTCLLGGFVRRTSLATSGPFTEALAGQINADIAIIAPDGIHPDRGVTFDNAQDAMLARCMAMQSRRVVVVATRAKLMSVSRVTGFQFDKVHQLITGCPLGDIPAALRKDGLEILPVAEGDQV